MGIVNIVLWILNILSLLILVRALMSWFDPSFRSSIGRAIFDITEPVLAPLRRVIPPMGAIDISTIVAIVLIQILGRLIASSGA
ncbi:MAG TPA: YggT family protein [Thermomicrobiales bacterium]|nr:YggT family protein [Thermomicrobiales bacterium]